MKFSTYKKLLTRYLRSESSTLENDWVDSWYDSFEQEHLPVEVLEDEYLKQGIKERIAARVLPSVEIDKSHRSRLMPYYQIAAACILLVITTLFIRYNFTIPKVYNRQSQLFEQQIQTGFGERKKIQLADGSTVMLNAHSSIRIASGYGQKRRTIQLVGEAFFDMKEQANCPVEVLTDQVDVQVLGTSFNVQAYTDQRHVDITVRTGKVRVQRHSGKQTLLLTANESGRYDLETAQFQRRSGSRDQDWLEGRISLEQANFETLANTFYRLYGIPLKSQDPQVLHNHYTLSLKYDRTMTETIETISHILNKQYRKEADGSLTVF